MQAVEFHAINDTLQESPPGYVKCFDVEKLKVYHLAEGAEVRWLFTIDGQPRAMNVSIKEIPVFGLFRFGSIWQKLPK